MNGFNANARHRPQSDNAPGPRLSGKDLAIEELMKCCRECLNRARTFRRLATTGSAAEQGTVYRLQARFEVAKARGYLRQANFLRQTSADESARAA